MATTDDEAMDVLRKAIKRRIMETLHDTINRQPSEEVVDAMIADVDILIDAKILVALEKFGVLKRVDFD